MKGETTVVSTRIPLQLAKLIDEYCKRDAHLNLADFIRDAIRYKLKKEAPELYYRFLKVS